MGALRFSEYQFGIYNKRNRMSIEKCGWLSAWGGLTPTVAMEISGELLFAIPGQSEIIGAPQNKEIK
jgi:hypothetical protein